ncbi:MAG: DUF2272 domain-containing protein [Alphaproteobacteria bacterium]|nr:DUF2272 domain-containing protein [Alphaproteobacteria bacterium]
MPATTDAIVAAATAEWEHWGKSTWNPATKAKFRGHIDDEEEFAQYVIDTYCKVAGGNPTTAQIANDEFAWSAVCISAIMAKAGFTKPEFPFSPSHSTYIRHFIKKRNEGDATAAYWGFRLHEPEATPMVGDLIGYARADGITFQKAQAFFDRTSPFTSHTDVVVARRPGEIDVIGGNVLDSVTMKTLRLAPDGSLADRNSPWFVVMRKR